MKKSQQLSSFPLTRGRAQGYKPQQVDEFLALARKSFESEDAACTVAQVRAANFKLQRRGYAPRLVDSALDRLEDVFYSRERQRIIAEIGEDAWWRDTRAELSEIRLRLVRQPKRRFRRRGIFARGYDCKQVDAFLDEIAAMFAKKEVTISQQQVRDTYFRSRVGGYDEDQVDALLDSLTNIILATQ